MTEQESTYMPGTITVLFANSASLYPSLFQQDKIHNGKIMATVALATTSEPHQKHLPTLLPTSRKRSVIRATLNSRRELVRQRDAQH